MSSTSFLVSPYSVPLRSCYAKEVSNLFFAGRVMSASRIVFNSLRVMCTLAIIGQGVGVAAAYCAENDLLPEQLRENDLAEIQQRILRQDGCILHLPNQDPKDLARQGTVVASSEATLSQLMEIGSRSLSTKFGPLAALIPISTDHLESLNLYLGSSTLGEKSLSISLHRAMDIWDLPALEKEPVVSKEVKFTTTEPQWVNLPFEVAALEPGIYWVKVASNEDVTWFMTKAPVPGCTAAKIAKNGVWQFAPAAYSDWEGFAIYPGPESRAFSASNVNNGVARPESWPNIWISDPRQELPQWLQINLPEEREIRQVDLRFDTNLARYYEKMGGCYRSPEAIADYDLQVWVAGYWQTVKEIRGNYQRHNVIDFEPLKTKAIRILIHRTNGCRTARIYEVRIY